MANPRNQSNNQSPMAAMNTTDLPKYNPVSSIAKREALKLRSWQKRVHFIPLVVILCFIILWLFGSRPHHPATQGNVTIEDEIINNVNEIDEPERIKETDVHVDLPILAVATPGNASAPELLSRASPEIVPSPGRGNRTDLNPGLSASRGFGPHRALLQIVTNKKINELGEIKKPESIKEARYVLATRNASDPQPLFQASPEIAPLPVGVTRTDRVPASPELSTFRLGKCIASRRWKIPGRGHVEV